MGFAFNFNFVNTTYGITTPDEIIYRNAYKPSKLLCVCNSGARVEAVHKVFMCIKTIFRGVQKFPKKALQKVFMCITTISHTKVVMCMETFGASVLRLRFFFQKILCVCITHILTFKKGVLKNIFPEEANPPNKSKGYVSSGG